MAYGTGEWRQLLLDMQEIVDWLSRAGQELLSQQPIASDIEKVQSQNKHHQVNETKPWRLILYSNLEVRLNYRRGSLASLLCCSFLI